MCHMTGTLLTIAYGAEGAPVATIAMADAAKLEPQVWRQCMATDHPENSVTEEQDGQFSTVSDDVPISAYKEMPERHVREAGELLRRDAGDVNAEIVTMERSGAEHVEGERVSMESSGARTLSARTVQMENSGAVMASAERMVLQGSSAITANAQEMRLARSKALIAGAGEMVAEQDVSAGMLAAGSVKATGDIRTTFLVAGEVSAEGDVEVKFDAASAFALGAGFAAMLLFVRGVLRRIF